MFHRNAISWTKAEKDRIKRVLELGCGICGLNTHGSPLEVHHLVEGNRRMGHGYTVCLCAYHHRGIGNMFGHAQHTSLVHGSKLFTQAYGTQRSLWEATQRRLGLPCNWPESKILARRV